MAAKSAAAVPMLTRPTTSSPDAEHQRHDMREAVQPVVDGRLPQLVCGQPEPFPVKTPTAARQPGRVASQLNPNSRTSAAASRPVSRLRVDRQSAARAALVHASQAILPPEQTYLRSKTPGVLPSGEQQWEHPVKLRQVEEQRLPVRPGATRSASKSTHHSLGQPVGHPLTYTMQLVVVLGSARTIPGASLGPARNSAPRYAARSRSRKWRWTILLAPPDHRSQAAPNVRQELPPHQRPVVK